MRTAIYLLALAIAGVLIESPPSITWFLILLLLMFLGMDIYALLKL